MTALARLTDEDHVIPLRPRAAGSIEPACPHCGALMAVGRPVLDLGTHTLRCNGRTEHIDRKMARLLGALIERSPGCATHDYLTARIWGEHPRIGSNALAVHVSRARRVLRRLKAPVAIDTLTGTGYRLRLTGRAST